jgi:hypothetical protein
MTAELCRCWYGYRFPCLCLWLLLLLLAGAAPRAGAAAPLPPCDEASAFNGSWTFHEEHNSSTRAYSSCPKTRSYVAQHAFLYEHIKKYSCTNAVFRSARYDPTSCRLIKLVQSIEVLSRRNAFITLVGDSLMAQLYVALLCTAEQHYLPAGRIALVSDLYLRPDVPCSDQCISNQTFLREAGDGLIGNPCAACKYGKRVPFDGTFSGATEGSWPSQIPRQTTVLVLGSGAWYHNKLDNPDALYVEMLAGIGPYLGHLTAKGVAVYWHDLPPMHMYEKTEPDRFKYYGWNVWHKFNENARAILSPHGVKMLATSAATRARKVGDPGVSSDYIHWCSPGRYTVPQFVAAVLLRLLAV